MDPLTSLSLACNVIQLVDFGLKTLKKGAELASHGSTDDHRHLEILADNTLKLCDALQGEYDKHHPQCSTTASKVARLSNTIADQEVPSASTEQSTNVAAIADKTKAVAEDLRSLMQGLRLDDNVIPGKRGSVKRKLDVATRVVKGAWRDREVQDLRRRLLELQQSLALHLSMAQSQSSSEILASLGTISIQLERDRIKQLAQLSKDHAKVLGESSPEQQPTLRAMAPQLHGLTGRASNINLCVQALNSLFFEEMQRRDDSISEVPNSFEWVFSKASLGFAEWLRVGNGTYWITGKPGSGKSTMMKYISDHRRCRALLKEWAGEQRLIVARHYFWNAGTTLQKSIGGLLRTLLHHLLTQCPELAPLILPQDFRETLGISTKSWTLSNLKKAFNRCSSALITVRTCVCYFIDGLDECDDEHLDLVDFMQDLSRRSGIKICTSSRPWNVFLNAYESMADGHFKMQDLNGSDIKAYVSEKMYKHPRMLYLLRQQPVRSQQLIQALEDRAEGVFLWVVLVMRSLSRGLENHDTLDILHQRLKQYPTDLDEFFSRMFDRVEDIYQQHGSRILLFALQPVLLTTMGISCLQMEAHDPLYAEKLDMPCSNIFADREALVTQRYIDASCADLVVLKLGGDVETIHRTVTDFLKRPTMQQKLFERAGSTFDIKISKEDITGTNQGRAVTCVK